MKQTSLEYKKFIFGSLFIVANHLQTICDRFLEEITTKQWLLLVMISQFEEQPPSLGQVAVLMGSSHQNTKQIALKLEEKGFIIIERATNDRRALCLKLTDKCHSYFKERDEKDINFIEMIFSGFENQDLKLFARNVYKLINNLSKMDNTIRTEEFDWIRKLLL